QESGRGRDAGPRAAGRPAGGVGSAGGAARPGAGRGPRDRGRARPGGAVAPVRPGDRGRAGPRPGLRVLGLGGGGADRAAPAGRRGGGSAVRLIAGQGAGFLAWVVGELTVLPLLADAGLRWSLPEARASFPDLPGWLLLGARAAPTGTVLGRLAPLLSSEHLRAYSGAAAGSGVLAAALRGAVAGLLGGAVISQLMLRGAVPEVAERLTGSNGPLAGIAVNLAIGVAIGVSYGLLFRRLGQDVTCALGWGLSYGFLWWVLGPLTPLPALLGRDPGGTAGAPRRAGPCRPWLAPGSTAAASASASISWRRRSGCRGWPAPGPRPSGPCAAARSSWPP